MKLQNGNPIKSKVPFSNFNYARRNFIKTCSAATVGGVSSILLPQSSEANHSLETLRTKASQDIIDEFFWHFVRMQFVLKPGLIYMNTGTEGSMPRCILSRIRKYFREFAEHPMDAIIKSELYEILMRETRTKVAGFLGANLEEIVLTTNTTEGLCFTANGLDLQEGDEVLTTLHFSPYNCCWFILRDRRKVTVTELELPTPADNKEEIIALFEDAITPQTKVMNFCHINYTTGLRMPVKELCQLAQDHDIISVVDGAHAIGMLNFSLHELGCDFYACSPHKWLNAPPGTGVLYMREEVQGKIWPTVTESYPSGKVCNLFQVRGQQCTPIYACLNDAIDFQNAIGKDKIQDRIINLSTYLKGKIVDNWGEEKLFSPTDKELSSGLVSFNPFDDHFGGYGDKISKLFWELYDNNIITRGIGFKDKLTDTKDTRVLRISTHIYNNYYEIDRVIDIIKTIIANL